ncbi:MAG: riboflavin synthase [Bacteroidetes bacterium]|nr:riboflavin synthase [Bacteroidota bacterium]
MFTGIIEAVGRIEQLEELGGGRRLTISCPFADELSVDESVAVNGTCLTVVAQDGAEFEATAVEETLAKTSLRDVSEGDTVNIERAMQANGRFDGHVVQGHVDTTGVVETIEQLADSWLVAIRYPESYSANLIPVGSITIDGISLTVARLAKESFTVAIIPHTWENTTIHDWQPGRRVNLEFDVIGKYVARMLEKHSGL